MRATNLTLLTDLYELTMMQGYFKNPTNQTVIFDMFHRVALYLRFTVRKGIANRKQSFTGAI